MRFNVLYEVMGSRLGKSLPFYPAPLLGIGTERSVPPSRVSRSRNNTSTSAPSYSGQRGQEDQSLDRYICDFVLCEVIRS